jgi:hypothetical protein
MMSKKVNPTFSFALECALLFLAISVFSWGLQAKLSLYHAESGRSSSTSSMAKLSTEKHSARSVSWLESQAPSRLTSESLRFVAFAFLPQGHDVPSANPSQVEPRPGIPGQYNLHGPNLMRRPPPVLC